LGGPTSKGRGEEGKEGRGGQGMRGKGRGKERAMSQPPVLYAYVLHFFRTFASSPNRPKLFIILLGVFL